MLQRQNQIISKTIIYGTISTWLGKKADEKHTHQWICYVRGLNNEDLSYCVEKVIFVLHSSFDEPTIVITSYPFVIQEKGWGQFEIQIKIYLKGQFEQPLVVNHMLKLYSSNNQNTPLSKKPVVHEQQDEMVFVNPKDDIIEILQRVPEQIVQEIVQPQITDDEPENQADDTLTAAQHYKILIPYFQSFDDKEYKLKLESAINFVNSDVLFELFRKNRQLDEEIQNLEFDIKSHNNVQQ